jgi:Ca-activated chloride channel family protein
VRALLLPLALLAALPSWLHLPTWAERWLYNPRERTTSALAEEKNGKPQDAVAPFETAARLAGDDPVVQYNAGAGHLLADQGKDAVPFLEKAAEHAPPALKPRATYNLGNAKLAAGDAAGAVEAYKNALRLDPANEDAKWNLELALRQLEKERQAKKPQEAPNGQRQGEQEHSQGSGAQDPSQGKKDDSKAQDPGKNEFQPPQQGGQHPQQQGLGNFQEQPDMTAQQAAALLESVENLERQQRKAELAARTRKTPKGVKDW